MTTTTKLLQLKISQLEISPYYNGRRHFNMENVQHTLFNHIAYMTGRR